MTVYNVFFKIIKNHLVSIALYFIIFAILIIILSNPATNNQDVYKQEEICMSVIDRDNSTLSKALTEYIDSSQELIPLEDNKEVWTDELFIRSVEYILIIPENFEADMLSGKSDLLTNYKLPGSTSGSFIDMQIDQYLKTLKSLLSSGENLETALTDTENIVSISSEVRMINESGDLSESKPMHYYFFQYLPYLFICMVINGLGPVLMAFRNKGIKERINCSAMSLISKNIQLILSSIVFSFVLWILFMILGISQYSSSVMSRNYILLTINSLVLMCVVLSMTFLIIHFVKNENILNMVSNVFGLGSSFLCGIFVPRELLSNSVLFAGQFLPPYWYIEGMNNIFSGNLTGFSINILIQIGFAIAFLMIALVVSKQKDKSTN